MDGEGSAVQPVRPLSAGRLEQPILPGQEHIRAIQPGCDIQQLLAGALPEEIRELPCRDPVPSRNLFLI